MSFKHKIDKFMDANDPENDTNEIGMADWRCAAKNFISARSSHL